MDAAFENIKFICADAANLDEITTQIAPNSIDMGILRLISRQSQNKTVFSYSDKYTVILNL